MAGSKFIAASHQMFQPSVGVVRSRLHAFNGKTEGSGVSHRLLFSGRNGPVSLRKLRVAMNAEQRFRKPLLELLCLTDGLACGDLTQALNDRMFGHVAVPLKGINDVAVFINNSCGPPIVPQPHGWPLERLILTLALQQTPRHFTSV